MIRAIKDRLRRAFRRHSVETSRFILLARRYARRFDAISTPALDAEVFYDVMSGGLVWTDEQRQDLPGDAISALRPLWRYRSTLLAGAPEAKWKEYWEECVRLFPRWIGFLPERRMPSAELAHKWKVEERGLRRCLWKAEREEGGKKAEPGATDNPGDAQ